MSKEQIIVQINPDVPPTGSDLGIINAARKSFGRRSDWDIVSYSAMTKLMDTVRISDYDWIPSGTSGYYRKLRDKDKRLLEFLARGMTSDDFDGFMGSINNAALCDLIDPDKDPVEELTPLLWQWRNTPTHDTPFNHGFFSFEVKAPIFVARHLVKHEYLIMSEYSRRYITDDVEFYCHDYRQAATDKKQGSGGLHEHTKDWERKVHLASVDALERYNAMLADGVAPEQARGHLPQDLMTSWTWSGTMGAFANMCKLRLGSDTQVETRYVAEKVYEELKKQFPVAAPLLVEGVH